MPGLTIVSGDFSSGTTLLFTLFRNTPGCHCFYEPLHEKLLEWLVWSPRIYDGHVNVGGYVAEYKRLSALPALYDPKWGISGLHLSADEPADDLNRYLSYLIGAGYAAAPTVVLKENRFTFRLGWLKAKFPNARIVHVWRDLDDQWESYVRRAQQHLGREDVGQDSVNFMAFRLAAWCEDLKTVFPELAAERSSSGYERFSKLWHLSRREHERYADVSMALSELKDDFDATCSRISDATGEELDPDRLRALLATGPRGSPPRSRHRLEVLVDRLGARYASARVSARSRRARGVDKPGPQ